MGGGAVSVPAAAFSLTGGRGGRMMGGPAGPNSCTDYRRESGHLTVKGTGALAEIDAMAGPNDPYRMPGRRNRERTGKTIL